LLPIESRLSAIQPAKEESHFTPKPLPYRRFYSNVMFTYKK